GHPDNEKRKETQEGGEQEDTRIGKLTCTELLAAMSNGELSSRRVVAAFSRRAHAIGHLKTRSVTEEFYDEAIREAAAVDSARAAGA
ncbi:unnamed protein product, partial [Sphacelaria rigidula]